MSDLRIIYEDTAPNATDDDAPVITDIQDFCDPADITLEEITVPQVATLEDGYWILGEDFKLFPDAPTGLTWGIWSLSMCGADGSFATPITLTRNFLSNITSVGVTFWFDPYGPTWCDDLTITWLRDGVALATEDFAPDAYKYSCIKIVKSFDQIQIQFKSMSAAYRYLKLQRVMMGIFRTFGPGEYVVGSLSMHQAASPVSNKLEADTMEVVLKNKSDIAFMFQRKQPLKVYDGEELLSVSYNDTSELAGANAYRLSNSDLLMLLGEMDNHKGGMYNGAPVEDVLDDIMGGLPYELDSSFAGMPLTGYLPIASRLDNLAQVALALGAMVDASRSAALRIFPEPSGAPTVDYGADYAYYGGSIKTTALITSVKVTAHTYAAGTDTQQLYNAVLTGTADLTFSSPMCSLSISGGTITAWGANWATITGTGGTVVLTGAKYVHGTQITTLTNPRVTTGDLEKVKTVPNATLVNPGNVAAVAQRIYNHYLRRNTATKKVILGEGKPGGRVTIDTDSGTRTGVIISLDIIGSNTLAAEAKILCDYEEE